MNWINFQENPPHSDAIILMKFFDGVICSGTKRHGVYGEPQPDVYDWRCDCCGCYGTPISWCYIPC